MKNPKVGDRVKVYCATRKLDGNKGVITDVRGYWVDVKLDDETTLASIPTVHEGQCVRLRTKPRRRVWVGEIAFSGAGFDEFRFLEARTEQPSPNEETSNGNPWVEFVEVRRKK